MHRGYRNMVGEINSPHLQGTIGRNAAIVLAMAVVCLWLSPSQATDTVQLNIQTRHEILAAGQVNGDLHFANGLVAYDGEHTGFRVWSDAPKSGAQPNRYVLNGSNDSTHTLRVRIEKEGWVPDNDNGEGIVLFTSDDSATFHVVIDGDQHLLPDSYSINLKGAALLP